VLNLTIEQPGEKKSPKIAELAAVVSVMVSILIAGTTLLNNTGNLPSWWFDFSLILLIALTFFMPVMIFVKPVRERIKQARLGRKRNAVSRKYSSEFKDLLYRSRGFNSTIRTILDSLRTHYANDIKSRLATHVLESYGDSDISTLTFNMEREIDESKKTFRDIYLIMKNFEMIMDIYKKNLKIMEVFVHEMISTTGKPIAKGIEDDFEAFRDKYNDFIKDATDFCHKMNQETECGNFPEHSFEYLKKW